MQILVDGSSILAKVEVLNGFDRAEDLLPYNAADNSDEGGNWAAKYEPH